MIISHDLWQQRLGGDRAVIGRSITLDGEAYQIIGVLPAGFQSPEEISERQPMMFVVPDCWPPNILHNRGEHYDHAIARLKPGVSLAQAQSEIETIGARLAKAYPGTNGKIALGVAPLGADMVRRVRTAMLVLLGAVGLVLLIACANVANLLLARSAGRGREIAIRLAMGASRGRIVRELLVESAVLAVVGCVLGLLLGVWTRDLLVALAPKNIPRLDTAALSWRVLGFTGVLATITVFLFGTIPAWQASGIRPNEALKSGERATGSFAVLRWRNALMAAEVALALMLLVGGALLWKSFVRVTGVDLGFQPDRVLMVRVNLPDLRYPDGARRLAFFQELEQRVTRLPGVRSAGFTFCGPMRGGWGSVYQTPEGPGSEPDYRLRDADFEPVSPRYFETLGIPILKGRAFTPADKEGAPPAAIINQVLARKLFPNGDAIGHRIRREGARDWETIVGVVGEVHLESQTEKVHPQVFFPAAQTSLYPVPVSDFAIHTAGAPLGYRARRAAAGMGHRQRSAGHARGDARRSGFRLGCRAPFPGGRSVAVCRCRPGSGSSRRLRGDFVRGGPAYAGNRTAPGVGCATSQHPPPDDGARFRSHSGGSRRGTRRSAGGIAIADQSALRSEAVRSCDVCSCGSVARHGRTGGLPDSRAARHPRRSYGSPAVRVTLSASSRRSVAAATSCTAESKASWLARDGL